MAKLLLMTLCALMASTVLAQEPKIKVTTIEVAPFFMASQTEGEYEGFIVDLMKQVGASLDREYEFHIVKDGKYGEKSPNDTWDGMIGELIRKEADVAAAPLTITSTRERVVDFTKPFLMTGIQAVVAPVTNQRKEINIFMIFHVFTFSVWLIIILAFVLACVGMWLLNRVNPYETQADTEGTRLFNLQGSFWFGISTFMWQGYESRPRSLAGRVLVSFWFMFVLITLLMFTAGLVHRFFLISAHMYAESARGSPFDSLTEVVLNRPEKYSLGCVEGGSTEEFFFFFQVALYERLWFKMSNEQPPSLVRSVEEGIERTRRSKYVFFGEGFILDSHMGRAPCRTLTPIGGLLNSKGYGLATPPNSPLKDRLNQIILELHENGYMQKLQKNWLYDRGQCAPPDAEKKPNPWSRYLAVVVTERAFAAPTILLLLGFILTAVVCVAEIICHRRRQKESPKTTSVEEGELLNEAAQREQSEPQETSTERSDKPLENPEAEPETDKSEIVAET